MMRSVQRILSVFESFAPTKTTLTLQEIADRIELPKSTAFRIVGSLERAGYLVRLEDQRYCLSFRFTRLAGLVKSTLDIREIARPIMMELADKTQEMVGIHTVVGRNRVCIDSLATATTQLRTVIQPGEQFPLVGGSGSKTLMAYMAQQELGPILAAAARASKRSQSDLLAELEKIRRQGYAVSHGERLLGLSAISAPILDINEQVRYCLTLNGPSVRLQVRETEFITLVRRAAADISLQFGAPTGPAIPSHSS
ncbi:IclR family transcriptional regulator [Ramlibacter sp. 2FC]|uniref:IclR family transcriptional regulator n=1 Tax=Ramlibacter sp. 2FC TaxID=2502188 RepID=UPI0010F5C32D|nr:IclR family transcriptional regulator [Ramlibacter sp. 2FC]